MVWCIGMLITLSKSQMVSVSFFSFSYTDKPKQFHVQLEVFLAAPTAATSKNEMCGHRMTPQPFMLHCTGQRQSSEDSSCTHTANIEHSRPGRPGVPTPVLQKQAWRTKCKESCTSRPAEHRFKLLQQFLKRESLCGASDGREQIKTVPHF